MSTRRWIVSALSASLLAAASMAVDDAQGVTRTGARHRDGWTSDEVAVLASLRLSQLPPAPEDPSNAVEASPAAVELGRRLFFDTRLSRNQAVACASCHDPAQQFQDGRPWGRAPYGQRRTMPIVAAAYSPWLFWDGRKDSMWSQALGPLEDGAEHGGNRLRYARVVADHHAQAYVEIFGPLPDLARLPQDAGPHGTPAEQAAWHCAGRATRDAISRVFANMGKAIAAYEKGLRLQQTRLDRYVDDVVGGKTSGAGALDAQEVAGLRLFIGKGNASTATTGRC
jgi:cytochrome c peroxidase